MLSTQSQPIPHDGAILAKIVSLVEKIMAEHRLPGLAIAIVRAGQVFYSGGFGSADVESDRPVTPDTHFNTASITKSFTAMAIVQLVEQEKIALDAKVTSYLPYFRLDDPRYKDITIRHLLSHTSGLPFEDRETDPSWKAANYETPETDNEALERYVRSISPLHLLDDPGCATLYYSNIGFNTLGDVIAKVSGQRL